MVGDRFLADGIKAVHAFNRTFFCRVVEDKLESVTEKRNEFPISSKKTSSKKILEDNRARDRSHRLVNYLPWRKILLPIIFIPESWCTNYHRLIENSEKISEEERN